MPDYANSRIVPKYAFEALFSIVGSIGNNHHACMNAVSHPHSAAMMKTYPTRTTCSTQQGIEQGPVGNSVASIEHRFRFAIRACNTSGIEVITTDNNWRFHFPASNE